MIYLKVHQNAQATWHISATLYFLLSYKFYFSLFVKNVLKNQGLGHLDF